MISARVSFSARPIRATPVRTGRRCTVTFAEKNPAEDAKEAVQEAAKTVEEAVKEAAGDVRKAVPEDAGKGFDKVLARKQANKNRDKEGDLKHGQDSGTGSGWPLNQ